MAVLVVGLGSAAVVWRAQDAVDGQQRQPSDLASLNPDDSARYSRQVEIYYGKVGVLTEKWLRGIEELGHGKALAKTLVFASLVVAGGLFVLAAGFRSVPPPE